MKAHLTPKWCKWQFNIPKGEIVVLRCCSKENSDIIDFIITSRLIAPEETQYKLYKVPYPNNPTVQFIKASKDPLILEDMVFGK